MHTTITSKGQVVIPSAVRRRFGICEGTRFAIDPDDSAQQIILTPITSANLESQRGRFRRRGLLKVSVVLGRPLVQVDSAKPMGSCFAFRSSWCPRFPDT